MVGDALRLTLHELPKVLDAQSLLGKKAFHGIAPTQGEIAFEQNTVETREHTVDLFAILTDKAFHGVLLLDGCVRNIIMKDERPF